MMDDLFDEIKIFLAGQDAIRFFQQIGVEHLTDRFLRDFSAAWGTPFIEETPLGTKMAGIRDATPPQEYVDFDNQQRQRQKADASVFSLDASGVTVLKDPVSGDLTFQQGHNHIVIKNGDCPDLAGIAMRATPQAPSPASVTAPTPATVQGPKFQGDHYSRQAKRNAENLEWTTKQEKKYHDTVTKWHQR